MNEPRNPEQFPDPLEQFLTDSSDELTALCESLSPSTEELASLFHESPLNDLVEELLATEGAPMSESTGYTLPKNVQAYVDEIVRNAPPIGEARARRIARMLYPDSGVKAK